MLYDIKRGDINTVLVKSFSRLTNSYKNFQKIYNLFESKGVHLVSLLEIVKEHQRRTKISIYMGEKFYRRHPEALFYGDEFDRPQRRSKTTKEVVEKKNSMESI